MRSRVLGWSIGTLALASACATSTGSLGSSRLSESVTPEPYTRTFGTADIDSIVAQAVADREGPRVTVRANVFANTSGSRRLRGSFRVEDDAYVVVGHVDADGIVRIVFPSDPKDDGFVRGGGRTYETSEFFAGFEDAYRFRYANYGRYAGYQPNAYDGSAGYLFVVASWRPLHAEKFMNGNGDWDSFEITEARYQDPRPAVEELAALLAGENREAYTLKFARYSNSMNYGGAFAGSAYSGMSLCSTFGMLGWGPGISAFYFPAFFTMSRNDQFYYRGQPYFYDSLQGCAMRAPYAYYGFTGAQFYQPRTPNGQPTTGQPTTGRTRVLGMDDSPRNPIAPVTTTRGRMTPATPKDVSPVDGMPVRVSPQYRQRGLITDDDQRTTPVGRTRPSISQMTERRTEDVRGTGRARYTGSDNTPASQPDFPRARRNSGSDDNSPRPVPDEPRSRPVPVDNERSAPTRSPRAEPAEPRPVPVQVAPRTEPAATPASVPVAGKPTPPPV